MDSTQVFNYKDTGILNSHKYYYQVSALNNKRIEGPLSRAVSAIPAVYGLIIEQGREYTNSKNVYLSFTATSEADLMQLSSDSTFVETGWEKFSNNKSFELTGEDGEKSVFAKFRNFAGNETINIASDKIILDRKAVIYELNEDSEGNILAGSDILHISLETKESGGSAEFDLGNIKPGILLYDDGYHGDRVGDDGIYEVNYTIPTGFEAENVTITGHFTDQAGNGANPVTTLSKISIQNPPQRIELFSPTEITQYAIVLNWTESQDQNFSAYFLYRSQNPGVSETSELIEILSDRANNRYFHQNLEPNSSYYYKVYVYDSFGLFSGSNEIVVTTLADEPPSAVLLAQPSVVDSSSLKIFWSVNTDPDFLHYCLYRSEHSPVDTGKAPVAIVNNSSTFEFINTGLERGKEYFYVLLVFDKGGFSTVSNEVSGKTN